ncbi:MAG TPA: MBL fold metallo-hydrolase [Gemmatimonadaceae bacterium]|nr:MBL fold metallo-hydrolase [Gemmatimonadaceae bacterium]
MIRRILVAIAASLAAAPLGAQQPRFETTTIVDGVYQFRWQGHNAFFVVTDAGVVAVDPISLEAAATLAAEIKRVAPGKPLRAIAYSHHHADHASGAAVLRRAFGGTAPIIAHANARPRLLAQPDTALPAPDVTFADQLTLHDAARPIELRFLGRAHSDNMIVAYLPQQKVVFAVDFVSNDRVGYRDLPDWFFPDHFDTLRRLQALDYQRIVFGHGAPGDKSTVDRQVRYYDDLRAAVSAAIARGASEEEAARTVQLPQYQQWGSYAEWFPLNVRGVYRGLSPAKRAP